MPNLYPVFDAPPLQGTASTALAPQYGRSWWFDFAKGDFVVDGAGRVAPIDGHRAWAQWAVKAIRTERFAHLAYGPGYGCELGRAQRQNSRGAAEAELQRAISEALLADPRTGSVRDFGFGWSGDELRVSFTAIPAVGTAERLEVSLSGFAA